MACLPEEDRRAVFGEGFIYFLLLQVAGSFLLFVYDGLLSFFGERKGCSAPRRGSLLAPAPKVTKRAA